MSQILLRDQVPDFTIYFMRRVIIFVITFFSPFAFALPLPPPAIPPPPPPIPSPPSGPMGPLSRSTDNGNYFAKPDGTPVYLTGAHTWNNFQDRGPAFPPTPLDYTAYINWMQSNGLNFVRLWAISETPFGASYAPTWHFDPLPWARTGPGNAADGKPKFDLTQFNQAYFDHLRARVIAARDRGIYVGIMFFMGAHWQIWTYHPFNGNNNINGINGDPSTLQTTSAAANAIAAQRAYVSKVIDTVNDLDNVLYEIVNEANTASVQWQYDLINYARAYQATKPKQHPIGMSIPWAPGDVPSNSVVFNSPADWVSPNGTDGYDSNPPAGTGAKVVISDTDHIFGQGGDYAWVWESFIRGLNPIFMDGLSSTGISGAGGGDRPGYLSARLAMKQTAQYAARLNLRLAKPSTSMTSTAYALVDPGNQYLVFAPKGGAFTVDLSAGAGRAFTVEWLNVNANTTASGSNVNGGSSAQSFRAAFRGPAVLFLNRI
jgi:hypothetical protein